jgi:hypothetical protein
MPFAWAAIGAAVAGVASSVIGSNASKSAADKQAQMGYAAIAEQRREFDIGQQALEPYRGVGKEALYKLSDYLGLPTPPGSTITPSDTTGSLTKPFSFDISKDPGYQFRLDEGTKAVENSAAARGSQLSGATLKELLRYGSDYASGEFNAAFQRDQATKGQIYSMLTGGAGIGIGATNTGVNAGTQTASNIGNTLTGIGNAQAAGTIGQANAITGGITGATNNISQAYLLKNILAQNNTTAGVNSGVNLGTGGAGDLNEGLA